MFSELTWQYFRNATHRGQLDAFTGEGWAGSRRYGQYVRMQVRLRDGRIEDARFETVGCISAIASCQALLGQVIGKSLTEAADSHPDELDQQVGGLPPGRKYCAEMAVHALQKALEASQQRQEAT